MKRLKVFLITLMTFVLSSCGILAPRILSSNDQSESGYVPVSSILVNVDATTVEIGTRITPTVSISPKNATHKEYTLTTDDETILMPSTGDSFIARQVGYASIYATSKDNGLSSRIGIMVKGSSTPDSNPRVNEITLMMNNSTPYLVLYGEFDYRDYSSLITSHIQFQHNNNVDNKGWDHLQDVAVYKANVTSDTTFELWFSLKGINGMYVDGSFFTIRFAWSPANAFNAHELSISSNYEPIIYNGWHLELVDHEKAASHPSLQVYSAGEHYIQSATLESDGNNIFFTVIGQTTNLSSSDFIKGKLMLQHTSEAITVSDIPADHTSVGGRTFTQSYRIGNLNKLRPQSGSYKFTIKVKLLENSDYEKLTCPIDSNYEAMTYTGYTYSLIKDVNTRNIISLEVTKN